MARGFRIVCAVAALAVVVYALSDSSRSRTASPQPIADTTAVPRDELDRSAQPSEEEGALNRTSGVAAASTPSTATMTAKPKSGPRRPTIVERFIPFPQNRKDEMAAYSKRHYGKASYRLTDPKVIVQHFTVTDSIEATYNTFAPNNRDVELRELPGVCSHFVIARNGTIVQLVPLGLRCRHTVGLNWTSIGIEHVGFSDREILNNRRQLQASLRLTAWLRCRSHIAVKNVIGHNESLSSPHHRERVARLQTQTHGDWTKAAMDAYRAKLRKRPACV